MLENPSVMGDYCITDIIDEYESTLDVIELESFSRLSEKEKWKEVNERCAN